MAEQAIFSRARGLLGADTVRLIRVMAGAAALGLGFLAHELAGTSAQARHPTASVLAWLSSIGLALVACASHRHFALDRLRLAAPRWPRDRGRVAVWMVGGGLFVLAFALRAYQNDIMPLAWSGDEGSTGLTAVRMLCGELTNWFGIGWYSFPALFFALPAASVGLLGPTYGALRLPSALAGALTVVGLYWWLRAAYGWKVGVAAALMLTASHYAIHWSRIGLNNIWDGLFVVWIGGVLWRGWQTGQRWPYLAAGVLTGLSQYFYVGSRTLPIIIACWLLSMALTAREQLRREWANIAALAFVTVVVFLPLGLFFGEDVAEFMAPSQRVSLLRRDWPEPGVNWFEYTARTTGKSVPQVFIENVRDAALGFVWLPVRSWYAESGKPLLLAVPAVLALFGLGWLLVDMRNASGRYLLLVLACTIGLVAISESTPAGQRFVAGSVVAAACVGLGFALLGRLLAEVLRLPGRHGVVLAACALVVGLGFDLNFYFREYAPMASRSDPNTQVATEVARRIATYPAGSQLYFFAAPRMAYRGFATMQFVAPHVEGIDVLQPLTAAPDWPAGDAVTAFAFTPERAAELEFVRQRFPDGRKAWINMPTGQPLVLLYEVGASRP